MLGCGRLRRVRHAMLCTKDRRPLLIGRCDRYCSRRWIALARAMLRSANDWIDARHWRGSDVRGDLAGDDRQRSDDQVGGDGDAIGNCDDSRRAGLTRQCGDSRQAVSSNCEADQRRCVGGAGNDSRPGGWRQRRFDLLVGRAPGGLEIDRAVIAGDVDGHGGYLCGNAVTQDSEVEVAQRLDVRCEEVIQDCGDGVAHGQRLWSFGPSRSTADTCTLATTVSLFSRYALISLRSNSMPGWT